MLFFQSLFGLLAPFGPPLDSPCAKCRGNGTPKGAPVDAGASIFFLLFVALGAPGPVQAELMPFGSDFDAISLGF